MNKSPQENATSQKLYASVFTFVWGTVAAIAQLVCLLSILEPRSWELAASFACWVYAGFYLLFLLSSTGPIAMLMVMPESLPKKPPLIWVLFSIIYNVAIVVALMQGALRLGVTLAVGYSTLIALKNWAFPDEILEKKPQSMLNRDAIVQPILFALLVCSLEFRSVPLAILLFVLTVAHLLVLLLKRKNEGEEAS